jgi:hypothetical protein
MKDLEKEVEATQTRWYNIEYIYGLEGERFNHMIGQLATEIKNFDDFVKMGILDEEALRECMDYLSRYFEMVEKDGEFRRKQFEKGLGSDYNLNEGRMDEEKESGKGEVRFYIDDNYGRFMGEDRE